MSVTVLDFETVSAGVAVTAGQFGASYIILDGGQTMLGTATAGQFFHGSKAVAIAATPTTSHAYGQIVGLNTPTLAADLCIKVPNTTVASDFHQVRLMNSAGTGIATVAFNTAGRLMLQGTGGTVLFTAAAAAPVNTWIRLKLWVQPGVSTTTGSAEFRVYNADTATLINTYSTTTANFGTVNIDWLRFGNSGGYSSTYFIDLGGYDPAATTLLPNLDVNLPPTVTAVANQNVAASASVSLSCTAADTDGTIASYAWTYDYPLTGGPTLTGGTTATPTFTAGAAGALYVLRVTVTDNNGDTGTATTEVRVPTSGTITTLPTDGTGAGTWTNVGGVATYGGALADALDATYAQSATATSTEQTKRLRLQPFTARTSLTLTLRVQQDTAGTLIAKARLYDGSTQRQEWTLTTTTSWADQVLTVTTPTAIADPGNCYLELSAAA